MSKATRRRGILGIIKALIIGAVIGTMLALAYPAQAHAYEGLEFSCEASWYGPGFYGNLTASGVPYYGQDGIVAHPSLPFGTVLYVETPYGSDYVEVADRGPYAYGRCLDFSTADSWLVGGGVSYVDATVVYQP